MFRLVHAVRYILVHSPSAAMQKVREMQVKLNVQYVGYVPEVILLVALGLGLYTQWSYTQDTAISIISLLGLFVFAVSCALRYYFSLQNVGNALFYIWTGCLTGIIAFVEKTEYDDVMHEVMELLFLTSMVSAWCWNVLARVLHLIKQEPVIISQSEALECLGLVIATACVMDTVQALSLSLYVVAFAVHLVALRTKSFLGVLSFLVFLSIGVFVFFPDLQMTPNKYALICFVGRHSFQQIIDFYFSSLTTIERWKPFFSLSKLLRHLAIIFVLCLELTLAVIIGVQSLNHKEWFVVVPIFAAFVTIWSLFHVIYMISCWKLMCKITDCNLTYLSLADEQQSFNRIMAAKGIRHFSLISQRLVCLSLTTSVVLVGVGWETRTPHSLSLALILLPIEAMSLSLFWALADFLGGTCTGFAVIAPVTTSASRSNSPIKLLSSSMLQEMTIRATNTLNHIHRLFGFHMIDNFGCDYSTSGLSQEYVETKMKSFFQQRTVDGPRFDTYLLYYSGDVHENGELAVADNKSVGAESVLEWWSQTNSASGSRLIIVVDIAHSASWLRTVRACRDEFVAVQTCRYSKPLDLESDGQTGVGSFTRDWVEHNAGKEVEPGWQDKARSDRAVYVVSRHWTDFTFHLPTPEDFTQYWEANFPKVTKPLMRVVNLSSSGALCCVCTSIVRCLRRKQMKWLPPKEIDTGHGFKLVRS